MKNKNSKLLKSFVKYAEANPEQRFYQCLKNWAGVSFVLVATGLNLHDGEFVDIRDTYNWDEKNK